MKIELIPLSKLKPHPRNYRIHTEEQLAHIIKSIEENGYYRNIIIAKDNTILAGHGVVEASAMQAIKLFLERRKEKLKPKNHIDRQLEILRNLKL